MWRNELNSFSNSMSPALDQKSDIYEYMLMCLIDWYRDLRGIRNYQDFNAENDFSKLKVIKLNFFVSAFKNKDKDLLGIFNNFHAMPLGPVESDLLNQHNSTSALKRFTVGRDSLTIKDYYLECLSPSFEELTPATKDRVSDAVLGLRMVNEDFVLYSAMNLVEISHYWLSWRLFFKTAQDSGRLSTPIPVEFIRRDTQYFYLSSR